MKQSFCPIKPKTGQEDYFQALNTKSLILCYGRAGCGKSLLPLSVALDEVLNHKSQIKKIFVVRPYIFATRERLGALPGYLNEKIEPFVLSIKDNLRILIKEESQIQRIIDKYFEFGCISTLRGRSLNNTFIIGEEMQNAHIDDDPILTLITRLGKGSKAVLSGDPDQCDIDARDSAFLEAINVFQNAPEASVIELKTIHRNPSINKFLTYFAEFRKKTNDI